MHVNIPEVVSLGDTSGVISWCSRAAVTTWGHPLYSSSSPFPKSSISWVRAAETETLGKRQCSGWLAIPRRNWEPTCPEYQLLGLPTLLPIPSHFTPNTFFFFPSPLCLWHVGSSWARDRTHCHKGDLSHSSDNAGFLTHYATEELSLPNLFFNHHYFFNDIIYINFWRFTAVKVFLLLCMKVKKNHFFHKIQEQPISSSNKSKSWDSFLN